MIRLVVLSLICMLFAANVASASILSCEASLDDRCGPDITAELSTDMGDENEPADPAQEHASQCHDHCKSGGRASTFKAVMAAKSPPAPLPVALRQTELKTLIRPPR